MLTAQVLNANATLNSFQIVSSQDFIPGSGVTLILRLFDDVEQLRYIPPSTAVTTLTFNNADGTTLTKTGSANADDRSMQTFSLTTAESAELIGGNALLSVDLLGNGTQIIKGLVPNVLQKITIDS